MPIAVNNKVSGELTGTLITNEVLSSMAEVTPSSTASKNSWSSSSVSLPCPVPFPPMTQENQ